MIVAEKTLLDKVVDFVIEHSPYYDRENIEYIIKLHLIYHTCIVTVDKNEEVTSVCRWNIDDKGRTAHILDYYIREDCRNRGFIKEHLIKGLSIFPTVKTIKWERLTKYPTKSQSIYSVRQLLRR